MPNNQLPTYTPTSKQDWRNWLQQNHATEQSIWLIYYRTSTKKPSLTWSEAVDEALCFGWIDSTKKSIDDERYMQYFSRRKPKSIWSKINKEKVDTLIKNNLMTKAGFESIEIAKENGSWTSLDHVEALIMPDDLKDTLEKHNGLEFFNGLTKSAKKILLHWVSSAKRDVTRNKRILEIAENAGENLKPKQFR